MSAWAGMAAAGWIVIAAVVSLCLVRAAIAYARQRGLWDLPGQRRSHRIPTPRGGGIGMVLAVLLVLAAAPAVGPAVLRGALASALLLVAGVGWWDDHRSLSAARRLWVQALAAMIFAVLCLQHYQQSWWWLVVVLPCGVWSINLHNFMDGIDGLLAQQTVFVAAALAGLGWPSAAQPALLAACVAAAGLGFAWFNRPPAQIFMGDVGSGSIGLLVFALTMWLSLIDLRLLFVALILSSAFVTDSSLTLLTRMGRRRAWLSPHREHLYQWLVRAGAGHARVSLAYLGWNGATLLPAVWARFGSLTQAAGCCCCVYVMATGLWWSGKHRLPQRLRKHKKSVRRRAKKMGIACA